MKKPSWKNRIKYSFDNMMSKGTLSLILLLFLITAVVVVISGIISALADPQGDGIFKSMWISLMHAIDAGTLAGDDGSIIFMVLMSIVTICGLFITSMLIGVISTGLEDKMNSLRKGHSIVLEKKHVILLGFNENALNIIRELIIANENHKNSVIVVMDNQDKSEMEDTINQRIEDTKTTRIICRSGCMDNIADVSICSPETCRSIIVNAEDDFMSIKAILACSTILDESENKDAYITALIYDKDNMEAARIAGNGKAEILFFQDSIARIMAQTCRQPGMTTVLTDLLSYSGDEIYVESIPAVTGRKMSELNLLFPKSTVIGIVQEGKPIINPPMDTVIKASDKLILIAEDDGVSVPMQQAASIQNEVFASEKELKTYAQNTLILGCNELLAQILTELDSYATTGDTVTVAAFASELQDKLPENFKLKNIGLKVQECNIFDRNELKQLLAQKPANVLILTDSSCEDNDADAHTLLLLLQLRDIARSDNLKFSVTSEMRSVENQELAQVTKVTDFVISSNITALMVTQISQTREQFAILDNLLSEEGSELYMKNVSRYVECGSNMNFYTVCASAARYGEVAIGYKKIINENDFEIVLNPAKNETFSFTEKDSLILVAEN
ncbi:MAG: hypothetical protein J6B81_05085 [Spirochaetaceae bacterium]|nr:hypothetical protein [Spirochaetaceae bacterium]